MNNREIREKISEGHIHVRAILEVVGKPKDYVEGALKDHLEKIKEDSSFIITNEIIEPAEEQQGFFSAFVELELLIKDNMALLSFCFDYMPSSVEILEPEHIMLNNSRFSGFLNDMQTRLHALNTGVLQTRDQNKFFIKNMAVLLRNFIVVLLSSQSMSLAQMRPYIGVKEEDIEKVLNVLIKEGKIKKDKDKYKAVPK